MKGRLIVFDGNDGSGKQLQSEMLAAYLVKKGKPVLLLSFPRYDTFFGKMISDAINDDSIGFVAMDPRFASLPYANDRAQVKDLMHAVLLIGGFVICDRYVSANQIHQGGKISSELKRDEFFTWLDDLEYKQNGLPRPDVIVYLDVPLEISLRLLNKKNKDGLEKNREYLQNSHDCAQFLVLNGHEKWAHVQCSSDGLTLRTPEDIHNEVIYRIEQKEVL